MNQRLNARQKLFAERCYQYHDYPTHTDAYLSVYGDNGNRRHAMINASRIYARPAVREYSDLIRKESARLTALAAEQKHRAFVASLKIRI